MSYSKWIGGGLGWAVGGPIGGLMGFALGALIDSVQGPQAEVKVEDRYDQHTRKQQHTSQGRQTTGGDVAIILVVLTAAVMKADGRVTRMELGHVREFFARQFGPAHSAELLRLLRDVLQREIPLREVCDQVRMNMPHPMRLQLMHYLIGLANSDGGVDRTEEQMIHRIAGYIGVSEKDLGSMHAMFRRPAPNNAYQILEVDASASDEEVKKAYRRMVMKHHPDKVIDLGEEFQKAAAEKFRKVQEAYERICKDRGIV